MSVRNFLESFKIWTPDMSPIGTEHRIYMNQALMYRYYTLNIILETTIGHLGQNKITPESTIHSRSMIYSKKKNTFKLIPTDLITLILNKRIKIKIYLGTYGEYSYICILLGIFS